MSNPTMTTGNALSDLAAAPGGECNPPESIATAFGHGRLIVANGTFHGRPAVFIAPTDQPGAVGAKVPPEKQGDLNVLEKDEQVFTFPTDQQARLVAAVLMNRIDEARALLVTPAAETASDAGDIEQFANSLAKTITGLVGSGYDWRAAQAVPAVIRQSIEGFARPRDEALRMLLAELSTTARPDGPLDPQFACPSMEHAYSFAQATIAQTKGNDQ